MSKARELAELGAVYDSGALSNRNLVINGAMQVSQRATSEASLASFSKYVCVDRFHCEGASSGTFTISQSSTAADGFSSSLKFDCTTADASPSYLLISYRFEGQDLQLLDKGNTNAKKTTLSFYVRSSKTGTYQVNLRDIDNTRQTGKTYTIDAADTWERKSVTFDGDTTGSFDNDNANSLRIEWWLASGSTYNSGSVPTSWEASSNGDRAAGLNVAIGASTSDDFHLTGVQLEVGSEATPFEHRSFGDEKHRCKRYFQKNDNGTYSSNVTSGSVTTNNYCQWFYVPEMRATPTLTSVTGTNDGSNQKRGQYYNATTNYAQFQSGSTADAEI